MWLKFPSGEWVNSDNVEMLTANILSEDNYARIKPVRTNFITIHFVDGQENCVDIDPNIDPEKVIDNIVNKAFAMPNNTVLSAELLSDGTIKELLMHGDYLEQWLRKKEYQKADSEKNEV